MGSPDSVISLGGNIDAEKRFLRVNGNEGRGSPDEVEDGTNTELGQQPASQSANIVNHFYSYG
ncbi:hypothetical protein PR003_g21970 [Phytophthora rubi]|nr:hypothetical protein PR003_g21970 [Phytophthora rubi]